MSAAKKTFLKLLMMPRFPALLRYVQRDFATIFMLHRFRDAERGVEGCNPDHLRRG